MERWSLLIFLLIAVLSAFPFNAGLSERYKHWYRPWLLTILILILLLFSNRVIDNLSSVIPWKFLYLEILFVSFIGLIWLLTKFILWKLNLDDRFLALLRAINKDPYDEKAKGISNYVAWPYYVIAPHNILLKAGTGFYRLVFFCMMIIIILIYSLSIFLGKYIRVEIQTGLALSSFLIFLEWFLYLSSDKEIFESNEEPVFFKEKKLPDYDSLWEKMVSTFSQSFNSAFVMQNSRDHSNHAETNDKLIEDLVNEYINAGCDIIASDLNLVHSFLKFRKILLESLNKGGNILILVEIPVHFKIMPGELDLKTFKQNDETDLAEIFTELLSREIQKQDPASGEILRFHYYDAKRVADSEKHRILLTSVNNMLNDNLLQSHWIKNLELLIVINFQDSCLSTISEDRQFSLLLENLNTGYRTLIFSPFRTEIHAGLEHTWSLTRIKERRFSGEVHAKKSYYIGYNFECWRENWNQTAKPLTGHPVYSGIELTLLPIAEGIDHIHLMETAYTEVLEGKEDLAVHADKINSELGNCTNNKILENIFVNPLPVPVYKEDHCSPYDDYHFSLIYDAENNAPRIFTRNNFLGMEQNFLVIVSKPHLFREYFGQNFTYFINNPIEAIQPQLSKSRINLAIQLFTLLRSGEVDRNSILQLFHQFGINEYHSVHEVIAELFLTYFQFNVNDNFALRYRCTNEFDNGAYRLKETFAIDKKDFANWPGGEFNKKIEIIDNAGNSLFNISHNLVFQNYLPGQTIAFNGRPYLFEYFSAQDSTLQVRKTESRNTIFYKPDYQIGFSGPFHESDITEPQTFYRKGKGYNIDLSIKEGEVKIDTTSYFEFISAYFSPSASVKKPTCHELKQPERDLVKRSYSRGRFLELNWDITPEFSEYRDLFTTYLHLLLYESLRIFYPYHYQYLVVISDNSLLKNQRNYLPWIFPENNSDAITSGGHPENKVTIIILEDSFADLGLLKSLQRNFSYIIKHLYDLLLWYGEENRSEQSDLLKYRNNNADKMEFLKYGLENPFIADRDILLKLLEEHLPFEKGILFEIAAKRQVAVKQGMIECDFCRKAFRFDQVTTLEDGLHRCHDCSVGAVDTMEDARQVVDQCKLLYKQHLDIDLDRYHYEFLMVTARELHQLNNIEFIPTTKYDTRKLVGQAWDDQPDKVFIEKGYKTPQTLALIIHELTHIWEYNELDCATIRSDSNTSVILEGLSVWTEAFLLRKAGYEGHADAVESMYENNETAYGTGFRYIKRNYPENPHQSLKREFPLA